ncbi:MAG: YggS family pyridoxal phosphate-dependent enzyme, partial [Acidobacteria bacterium]|nr:YggS family pyridoxal phosphate-dependent enzyme [Acidobacteriota bacterium]
MAFVILKAMADIRSRLSEVKTRIAGAARQAERHPGDITLVAVSKTHPVEVLVEAIAAGCLIFGENKVQEAEHKIESIDRDTTEWHLIGHLQSNKARKAVQLFDVIHTLDSIELASRLERICKEENRDELPVLVQVDLAGENAKDGIAESSLDELIEYLKRCERLK